MKALNCNCMDVVIIGNAPSPKRIEGDPMDRKTGGLAVGFPFATDLLKKAADLHPKTTNLHLQFHSGHNSTHT